MGVERQSVMNMRLRRHYRGASVNDRAQGSFTRRCIKNKSKSFYTLHKLLEKLFYSYLAETSILSNFYSCAFCAKMLSFQVIGVITLISTRT